MSNLKFSKNRFERFLSSKGFYAAIAACLIGAGAATWIAIDQTVHNIEDSNQQMIESETEWNNSPQTEQTEQKQSGVQQESASKASSGSASSSSSSSSSSASSAQQGETSAASGSSGAQTASSAPVYALPVKSEVILPFSGGELIKNTTLNDWRTHDGIDLAAEAGTEILAAADGTVSEVRSDPLWGTVVTIDHADGNQTVYCGLEKTVQVEKGDAVLVRQAIGKLEGVPCEINDPSHLHFAIKADGAWVDPLSILQQEITND